MGPSIAVAMDFAKILKIAMHTCRLTCNQESLTHLLYNQTYVMEYIMGFNLSSYSHCTSYTRLTTDTGNCCRACGWPFIKHTHIVT